MSRDDTLNQKIERNIEYIFRESKRLAGKYETDMGETVFEYIATWLEMLIEHYEPVYRIDFYEEIEMLQVFIKENPNIKCLKPYYSCLIKTNEMIKEKYKDKRPNPVQSFRQSLKEIKEENLKTISVYGFLEELEMECNNDDKSK